MSVSHNFAPIEVGSSFEIRFSTMPMIERSLVNEIILLVPIHLALGIIVDMPVTNIWVARV